MVWQGTPDTPWSGRLCSVELRHLRELDLHVWDMDKTGPNRQQDPAFAERTWCSMLAKLQAEVDLLHN